MKETTPKKNGFGPWIDRGLEPFFPRYVLKRKLARRGLDVLSASSSLYRGSESSRLRKDWISGTDAESTPDTWELESLRERARDLNRNDPISSGATDTLTQNIVGQGLRPQSMIRPDRVGLSEEQTRELRAAAENAFTLWGANADSTNRLDFDEMQFLAIRKIIEDGEIIVNPTWASDPWRAFGRILELVESDRLKTPTDKNSDKTIVQGVKLGDRNEPVKYWIKKATAKDYSVKSTDYLGIPARDSKGRPMIIHAFPSKRPGQVRGIPFFAPVLSYFKDLSDYLEAEIVAARVAACLAVFVTKTDAFGAAVGAGTETESGTGARIQGVEPGVVSYLQPGESIDVVDPKRGGESFSVFTESLLRIIGVSLGLPYELLLKDFSKTNYSSARAALLEGRRSFLSWRSWFARRFCQPIWSLVLEEAYLRGLFPVRDFYQYKEEYCRAKWIGGAWGWVDPVKEVESSKKAIDYGLSTLAEETAGQGRDWEEVLEQKARETKRAEELGVNLSGGGGSPAVPATKEES